MTSNKLFSSQVIVDIILNVTLIGTFIAVFFFTYGKKIEENIVKTQASFIAENLANDVKMFFDDNMIAKIRSSLVAPDMTIEDKKAKDFNTNLQNEATQTVLKAFIAGLSLSFAISQYNKLNFPKIVVSNLIILAFVGFTYYLFLTYFGQQFMSVDPNFVRHIFFVTLKEKLQPTFSEQNIIQEATITLAQEIQKRNTQIPQFTLEKST